MLNVLFCYSPAFLFQGDLLCQSQAWSSSALPPTESHYNSAAFLWPALNNNDSNNNNDQSRHIKIKAHERRSLQGQFEEGRRITRPNASLAVTLLCCMLLCCPRGSPLLALKQKIRAGWVTTLSVAGPGYGKYRKGISWQDITEEFHGI